MAKIIITIEDQPGNMVRVEATPNFETMMQINASGNGLTSAHGYALAALNVIRKESKKNGPTRIYVPRLGR